ncbi:M48 family metallopeptidase [Sulfobacillus sp. hq2]|uniref:M48 family metallopeptidase n=1 Tax=Sulfobacillus TaxID=28033 RepID=UPI000CD142CD|nr:SprT family zinc-dependent metalloprotease [Sulfobacillus sp. hq2]POB09488.1 hypothetical protein CO251_14770 [Sulfobacillus sp. hq2]
MPTITIGTTTIPYTIEERPRRQHPAIQIDASRQVTVLVPVGFDRQQIEPLVKHKARWLLKHWTAPPTPQTLPAKEFVSGEGFLLRGYTLRLKVQRRDASESPVVLEGRNLIVTVSKGQQPYRIREILVQWYMEQAWSLFPERIAHYAPIVGAAPSRLKIAEYKSRWGFCREDGLIALNWRIVQAPLSVIDYVIVHELTHRRYPHHRRTFWDAVRVILPDFEVQKQWLRDHGAELGW